MTDITIFHNPGCSTSRAILATIRESGAQPKVVEYLKPPPSRTELKALLKRAGLSVRDVLRKKAPPYAELGLEDASLTDEALLDAMMAHPILINRPIVITDKGVRLCRPSEAVLDLLDRPVASFTKEDGEVVGDAGARS